MLTIEDQVLVEDRYNKNQLLNRVKEEFIANGFIEKLDTLGIDSSFGISFLTQMAIHKRMPVLAAVGVMRSHYDDVQKVADTILDCLMKGLVSWDDDRQQLVVAYTLAHEVQVEIDRFQFPLPTVVTPKFVAKNTDTGYYTTKGSIILKGNHHRDDVVLEHINKLNGYQYSINERVMKNSKNSWRHLHAPKVNESQEDYKKRVRAFERYDARTREVMNFFIDNGNKFYFTHKYDKRGRTYCMGYHLNYMGTDWNKAVIEFTDKEKVLD